MRRARVEGDLERVLDRILESDLVDLEITSVLDGDADGVASKISVVLTMGEPSRGG